MQEDNPHGNLLCCGKNGVFLSPACSVTLFPFPDPRLSPAIQQIISFSSFSKVLCARHKTHKI